MADDAWYEAGKWSLESLEEITKEVASLRPDRDAAKRMATAIKHLQSGLDSGAVSGEMLRTFGIFAYHLIDTFNPSETLRHRASKGGEARHRGNHLLRSEAVRLYQAEAWESAKKAATEIFPEVQDFADENEIPRLSEMSGEETVYRWLRKFRASASRCTIQDEAG